MDSVAFTSLCHEKCSYASFTVSAVALPAASCVPNVPRKVGIGISSGKDMDGSELLAVRLHEKQLRNTVAVDAIYESLHEFIEALVSIGYLGDKHAYQSYFLKQAQAQAQSSNSEEDTKASAGGDDDTVNISPGLSLILDVLKRCSFFIASENMSLAVGQFLFQSL